MHGVRGALDRRFRYVRGVRIADRLVLHGAQAETLRGVIGRLLQPAVVEHENFGLAIFKEKLAIVGAVEPAGDNLGEPRPVQPGAIDQRGSRVHDGVP